MSSYRQQRINLQLNESDWREILNAGGIDAVMKKKKEIEDQWKSQPVLVAVVGQTGSGKSTFIRRLLDMSPDTPGEPVIGEGVDECTMEAKEYPKPDTGLVYVDLPGVGSTSIACSFTSPKEQDDYCERYCLQTIDYFLLLSQNKFNDQDKFLAEYITHKLNKKFVLVQTKMDLLRAEYGNILLEEKGGFEVVKSKIRAQIQKQLASNNVQKIFLVSNNVLKNKRDGRQVRGYDQSSEYEFDLFVKQIQDDMLGEDGLSAEKAEAFILATGAISASAIRATADILRKQRWKWATLSAVVGAVPIPGVSLTCDATIIVSKAADYFRLFGLNPIHFMGQGTAREKLKNLIQVMYKSLGSRAVAVLGTAIGISAADEGIKAVPIIGTIIGAVMGVGASFASTCVILAQLIDFCEIESLKLIQQN